MSINTPPLVPTPNGTGGGGTGAEVDAARAAAMAALERMVAVHAVERDRLKARLAEIEPEIRQAEKALAALRGEPLGNPQGKRGRPPGSGRVPADERAISIGDDRVDMIAEAIRAYAEDHEEFRQVDIRGVIDVTSGTSAQAFEVLRRRNVIRLARQDGNNKWYRLTREAMRES